MDSATGLYTVAPGDDLAAIAARLGVGVDALKSANGLASDSIQPGQGLKVPGSAPAPAVKYQPEVPAKITTPDSVETRIGTLRFRDGAPQPETVRLAYDQLDFGRGIDAFLNGMSATSVYAICKGIEEAGIAPNSGIGMAEDLLDARSLFLTANTTTVYTFFCLDLNAGPMVVRVPPRILGPVDDADFRWVTDVGFTGPDRGEGGDYLFVPPGHEGALPESGYHVARRPIPRRPPSSMSPGPASTPSVPTTSASTRS
jgi:LysM repeat protein